MPATIKYKEANVVLSALNEISTRRYEDTLFRVKIAENIRAIRNKLEVIGPEEIRLREDYCLRDSKDKPVMIETHGVVAPKINPELAVEFNEKAREFGDLTFEIPHSFTTTDMEKGKERIGDPESGFKVIKWDCEPWLYDALYPIFNSTKPKLVEDTGA